MGKFICFMGKSSTGKDTIFQRLLEDKELGLLTLVPYTTRPIRDGEVNGVEYFFTDEEGYLELAESGKIIEERIYDTYYGPWRYFTVDDGRIDLEHKSYAVIGTLEAYSKLCDFFGKDKVVPILIEVDDGVRLQRAFDREKKQPHPGYEEMCRRYLADCEDFSEDKIRKAGITRRFYNDDLGSCLKDIKKYIMEII
ncbi:MAG: guanylate kinase [Clostridiales bacterium]|mgnify:CR=1 FL=1|nr:guanylate kinase [Clostridiales bacterium]